MFCGKQMNPIFSFLWLLILFYGQLFGDLKMNDGACCPSEERKLLNSLGTMDWMTFRASIPFEILTRGFGLVGWWKTLDLYFLY